VTNGKLVMQDERHAAREAKLEAIRTGTAKSEKTAELKAAGKSFYKQMIADSDYQGEDYEVFAKWLSQGHGEGQTED
jgi:large subunit ribosomal protein L4e